MMNDNEIMKALECKKIMKYAKTCNPCDDCQHNFSKNNQESNLCKICEFKQALDLNRRQKAEIERLKAESEKHSDECLSCYAKGLSEGGAKAVKDFAERLKKDRIIIQMNGKYQHYAMPTKEIDKILKEMWAEGSTNEEQAAEKNEPLTLDELRQMKEATPVWWQPSEQTGFWCLAQSGVVMVPSGLCYDISECEGRVYCRKPKEATPEGGGANA